MSYTNRGMSKYERHGKMRWSKRHDQFTPAELRIATYVSHGKTDTLLAPQGLLTNHAARGNEGQDIVLLNVDPSGELDRLRNP